MYKDLMPTLVGETLTHVDVFADEILLTCQSGRKIKIYHDQHCCELVSLVDVQGNWQDLIGKVIVDTSEVVEDYPQASESGTETTLAFHVADATVITRWIGESNGYYSEAVHFTELSSCTNP